MTDTQLVRTGYRRLWARTLFTALCTSATGCLAFSHVDGDPETEQHGSDRGIVQTVSSLNNRYVLELWGPMDSRRGDTIYAGLTNSKKRVFVWGSDSVMENVAITDDGQTVVVNQHVSSGGDGAAYIRSKDGEYRRLFGNRHALKLVTKGKVKDLQPADLQEEPGRNLYCGLGLLPKSNELLFTFGRRHLIFYSLEERKITSWQRSILQYSGWRQDGASHFALRLDELSRKRGVTLCACETRRDGGDLYDRLITFPVTKSLIPVVRNEKELRLQTQGVELNARKTKELIDGGGTVWEVEITGIGAKYDALQERLAKIRSSVQLHEREPLLWKTPTSFTALPE